MAAITAANASFFSAWLDDDGATWIVSRDRLDDDGRAVTTQTLGTCESEAEAMADGRAEADRLGLPLYAGRLGLPAKQKTPRYYRGV